MSYVNTELAWIAGFFDGEGCVCIYRSKEAPSQLRRNGRGRHVLTLSLTQKTKEILDWVASMFGGRVEKYRTSKPCYTWTLCGRDKQRAFIYAVLPYLKLKKRQAELALEYLDTVLDEKQGYSPTPNDVLEIRQHILDEVKLLKHL